MKKLMEQVFSVEKIQKFILKNTSCTEKEALKKAYQTRMMIVSILFTIPILIVVAFTGRFFECLFILLLCKLIREQIGGIHVKGYLPCFLVSIVFIGSIFGLNEYITLQIPIEVVLALWIAYASIRYVPRGTSYRPITKKDEIKKMRIRYVLLLLLLVLSRFFFISLYPLFLWTISIMLLTVTDLAYRLFHVSTYRSTSEHA